MKTGCLLIPLIALSCSKSKSSDDRQPPVITLTSPASNQRFNAGEIIQISGTVTDNVSLAELHVHISSPLTGALLYDIHRYPASGNYAIRESFTAQTGVSYKIQVIAKDNSANEGRASVEISTN